MKEHEKLRKVNKVPIYDIQGITVEIVDICHS